MTTAEKEEEEEEEEEEEGVYGGTHTITAERRALERAISALGASLLWEDRDDRFHRRGGGGGGNSNGMGPWSPLISKIITHGPNRRTALSRLRSALRRYELSGPGTNLRFLEGCASHPDFDHDRV